MGKRTIHALGGMPTSTLGSEAKKYFKSKNLGEVAVDSKLVILNLLAGNKLELTKGLIDDIPVETQIISHENSLFNILQNKLKTKEFLTERGFSVTKGFLLDSSLSSDEKKSVIDERFDFPVMIKETTNLGGLGIYIIKDLSDLLKISFKPEEEYLVEEFILGIEYSGNLLAYDLEKKDMIGKNISIFPPTQKGRTCIGGLKHSLLKTRTTMMPKNIEEQIRELTLEIGKIEGVNGFLEVEFIFDEKDSTFKIIEINPRYAGTNGLSLAGGNYGVIELFEEIEEKPFRSNNILTTNFAVEYPIIHDTPNFTEDTFEIPEGAKLISKKIYKRFPPYLEMFLLVFDEEENAVKFLENNK